MKIFLSSALCIVGLLISESTWAVLPVQCEGLFFKTDLAIRDGKLDSAKNDLATLMARCPDSSEVLELSGIALKSTGKWEEAGQVYQKLYAAAAAGGDKSKKGFYAFDLGVISFLLNRPSDAEKFLREGLAANINSDVSHYVLGKILHNRKEWGRSKEEFHQVDKASVLKQLADYHYAQINFEEGYAFQGYESLVEAQTQIHPLVGKQHSVLLESLGKASMAKLQTEDHSKWMKAVGLSTDYDSNVFTVPNVGDANASSGSSSMKETVSAKLAYATSPIQKERYVGFYQGSVNYNFDSTTSLGQFMAHEVGGSWTHGFLKRTQYGAKLSGIGLWQYRSSAFRPYSLTGNAAGFVKSKLTAQSYLGFEVAFLPNKNYIDPSLSEDNKRSGWEIQSRAYYNLVKFKKYWSPSVGLIGGLMRPTGVNFKGQRLTLEVTNFMAITDQWYFTQSVGMGAAWYNDRSTSKRTDQAISGLLRGEYFWNSALTFAAQLDVLRNFSSDSSYRFVRWVGGVSASYLF